MTDFGILALGCVGGALPDLLRIVRTRHDAMLPEYLTSRNFWVGLLILVGLGGFAAWIGAASEAKEAIAYGFCAPEIISRLAAESGSDSQTRGGAPRAINGLRKWWAR